MLLHQIKFSLINMADKPDSDKAYEAEQFQDALQRIIEEQKQPVTSARIDDVDITGGYDSTVKAVTVAYADKDGLERNGKLVVEFTDGTTGALGFEDNDILTAYVHNEVLFIDLAVGFKGA